LAVGEEGNSPLPAAHCTPAHGSRATAMIGSFVPNAAMRGFDQGEEKNNKASTENDQQEEETRKTKREEGLQRVLVEKDE
jgi:hypothetical protein